MTWIRDSGRRRLLRYLKLNSPQFIESTRIYRYLRASYSHFILQGTFIIVNIFLCKKYDLGVGFADSEVTYM